MPQRKGQPFSDSIVSNTRLVCDARRRFCLLFVRRMTRKPVAREMRQKVFMSIILGRDGHCFLFVSSVNQNNWRSRVVSWEHATDVDDLSGRHNLGTCLTRVNNETCLEIR